MDGQNQVIIFYDGECGLCQRSIRILAKLDKSHSFRFAPQNGETFNLYFPNKPSLKTSVLVFHQNVLYEKSSALIKLGEELKGPYRLSQCLKIIPVKWLNFFYDQIAKRRHHVSCVLITKDQRFLK